MCWWSYWAEFFELWTTTRSAQKIRRETLAWLWTPFKAATLDTAKVGTAEGLVRKTWECTVSSITLSNPAHHHQREKISQGHCPWSCAVGAAATCLQKAPCSDKSVCVGGCFLFTAQRTNRIFSGSGLWKICKSRTEDGAYILKDRNFPVKTAEFAILYPLSLVAIAFVATQRAQTLRLEPLRGAGKQNMKVVKLENSGIIYPPIIHPSMHPHVLLYSTLRAHKQRSYIPGHTFISPLYFALLCHSWARC